MLRVQDILDLPGELSTSSNDSDSDSDNEDHTSVEVVDSSLNLNDGLHISNEMALRNYENAGVEVLEEPESILIKNHEYLMEASINSLLDGIVQKIGMQYQPVDFQRLAINALGQLKNVILLIDNSTIHVTRQR